MSGLRRNSRASHLGDHAPIWLPLILLAVVSLLVRACDLDRLLEQGFWSPNTGWHLAGAAWVQFLYRYGPWPALIVAASGLIVWLLSFFLLRLKPVRRFGCFLALAMALGPGLLINATLKEHCGRPRPRHVTDFGGTLPFRPLGEPTLDHCGKSFPSGHASTGFFWFAPSIYFWQRHRRVALGFAVLALVCGGLISLARMAQGAHWPSDFLWAGGIVYLSSWVIHRAFLASYPKMDAPSQPAFPAGFGETFVPAFGSADRNSVTKALP
jgi:membrane-associated PAP2 superfamily phosphatase